MSSSEASGSQRWLPIESNPKTMNKFLHECGVPSDWSMHDVLGLDPDLLAMLPEPVLAMLLLFPINEKYETFANALEKTQENVGVPHPEDLYYMKQTIGNACGTVALIHAVANNLQTVKLGDGAIQKFLDTTKDFTPDKRAEELEKDDRISSVHDDVAKEGQTATPELDDKVDYHFIVFVEKGKKLFELDGRKAGPVCYGDIKESFLASSAEAIKKYMENDPDNTNFSLIALAPTEK